MGTKPVPEESEGCQILQMHTPRTPATTKKSYWLPPTE